ncbi:EamA family transporter [Spirulina sp. CS-785/01]|uniref:EamA family transporter n=1 Tax=Spirulina sp. CS-785/01 TaxID=3021716 RepID=UPI002330072E|nr:DMT family transporter [Spirulina sp. CS-785/01]MDB9313624.1 EamA family transporter [Spirulina sp. CS-785/01]
MLWLLFAGATAFFESCKDIFSKKSLQNLDAIFVATALNFFTVLFLSPLLFFIEIPEIGQPFWVALVGGGVGNAIAFSLLMKAIQLSDLSKVMPLTSFTPLFLLVTSPLIVGEYPSQLGIIGIIFIVTGAYFLNINQRKAGFFAPLKALGNDTGTRCALAVAFIWSLNSNFDKLGLQNSSPLFWIICVYAVITLLLFPVALFRAANFKQVRGKTLRNLAVMGLFNGLTVSCQMTALSLTLVAYVISIKRTSTILSVFWGRLFFQETGLRERLLGASIMVLGVFAIAFSQTIG